jgi:hypothetical protein
VIDVRSRHIRLIARLASHFFTGALQSHHPNSLSASMFTSLKLAFASSIALFLLTGCASFSPSVTYSTSELQERLSKRFPMQKNLGGLVSVNLTQPRIQLQDAPANSANGLGRVRVDMQLTVKTPLSSQTANGDIAVSLVPSISPAKRAIVANDVRIDALEFAGQRDIAPLLKTLNVALQDTLANWVLYEFDKIEAGPVTRWFAGEIEPSSIRVSQQKVVIEFAAPTGKT